MYCLKHYELMIFKLLTPFNYLQRIEQLLKEFKSKPKKSSSSVSSDETDLNKPLNFDDDLGSNLTNFITQSES